MSKLAELETTIESRDRNVYARFRQTFYCLAECESSRQSPPEPPAVHSLSRRERNRNRRADRRGKPWLFGNNHEARKKRIFVGRTECHRAKRHISVVQRKPLEALQRYRETPAPEIVRTTEGIYYTASHRSQQMSQQQTVYQKGTTSPKRRCPRHCKPKCVIEVNDFANPMFLKRCLGLAYKPGGAAAALPVCPVVW